MTCRWSCKLTAGMIPCQGSNAQGPSPLCIISCVEEQYQIHTDVMDVARLENKGASPPRLRQ
jgi:hypothetical protein